MSRNYKLRLENIHGIKMIYIEAKETNGVIGLTPAEVIDLIDHLKFLASPQVEARKNFEPC